MSRARIRTGQLGEDRALAALSEKGYRLLARNYRCRYGEIDLVAEDGEFLVFVEVKARRGDAYGEPALSVTRKKQRRIARVALHYLSVNGMLERKARFDVVSLIERPGGWRVEILKDAFQVEA